MKQKQKTKNKKSINRNKLRLLYLVGFLLGFQLAMVLYVFSNFLKELSGFDNIGVFYVIGYLASFYILLKLHWLVRRYGKSPMLLVFLGLKIFALLGMAIFFDKWFALVFAVWSLMSGALMWACLDMVIESFSKDSATGSIRGAQLTSMNLGIFAAPFFATWVLDSFGYRYVFLIAAIATFFAVLTITSFFWKVNHNIRRDFHVKGVLARILKRSDVARVYYVALLLDLFYAIMIVYTPLYLLDLGMSFPEIGKIFTVMLIPFMVIQYPLGVLADKKTGEKELLMVGLLICGIFTATASFIGFGDAMTWGFVLLMTRIGAAIIEVMRESYFFKKVKPSDVDIIDYFRTTRSVSYIVGMAISAVFLIFFDIRYIFLMLAVLLFSGIGVLWKLKDTR